MRGKKLKKKFFILVDIKKLKTHEKVEPDHFKKLMEKIKKDGILKRPIVVDRKTGVALDGHHRLKILNYLGCRRIPIIFVNYYSPRIKVFSWRKGKKINKKDVIEAGISGRRFLPKTSRHMIKTGNELRHISFLQKRIDIPLKKLKD